jgi:hypothetical protein
MHRFWRHFFDIANLTLWTLSFNLTSLRRFYEPKN